jgi:hypothetical protein
MFARAPDFVQPDHWNLLSSDDAQAYIQLSMTFHASSPKSGKGERVDTFPERLTKIRAFVERDEKDSWKRSLVCGVFFLPDGFALHIRQLQLLMGKCKSSINGSLHQMGYSAHPQFQRLDNSCFSKVPDRHMIGELKNWTVRKKIENKPFVISIPREQSVTVKSEQNKRDPDHHFPCPVKWRYKFWDTIKSIRGNQPDGE